MRILTICANYPPYHAGGYGIRIKNIMDHLSKRGYGILVLTNISAGLGADDNDQVYPVKRVMHESHAAKFFPKEVFFDLRDVSTLYRSIKSFKPDLIYLGHTYTLTKQLFPFLSTMDIPIVCDEGGNSLKGAWTEHGRWFRFTGDYKTRIKWMNRLKPLVVSMVRFLSRGRIGKDWYWPEKLSVIFNSKKNRDFVLGLGVPIKRSEVLYSGIDAETFTFRLREALSTPIKIICPGRIEPRKGQLDAVRLVATLRDQDINTELVLVGKVVSAEYGKQIIEEIDRTGLNEQVQFLPMVSQVELVSLYHQADICFFPSYQESGLSRIPLEAMACGCVVVSYGNEGSNEIIRHANTGFMVSPGDFDNLVEIVNSLLQDPAQFCKVLTMAHQDVVAKYTLENYVSQLSASIQHSIVFENSD